jgi:very-short-patch-repair endonuclease
MIAYSGSLPLAGRAGEGVNNITMYRDRDQRDFARDLRNQMTEAEKRLWRLLRAQQIGGWKFRRQAAIGPYVVDFVCFSHKLIVELDGPQHAEDDAAKHDARRTAWLA